MRTKKYAIRLVRSLIVILNGAPLPRRGFLVILSDSDTGAPSVIQRELPDGTSGMGGISIRPARFWQTFSRPGVAAICSHEMSNLKHPRSLMEAELDEKLAAVSKMYQGEDMATPKRGRRDHLRMEYELYRGLLVVQLARKLWVDNDAIRLMMERRISLDGYLEFLEGERDEEMRQVEPLIRKVNRTLFAQIRLDHARFIVEGDPHLLLVAEGMRRHYEQWSRRIQFAHEKSRTSDPKTPPAD